MEFLFLGSESLFSESEMNFGGLKLLSHVNIRFKPPNLFKSFLYLIYLYKEIFFSEDFWNITIITYIISQDESQNTKSMILSNLITFNEGKGNENQKELLNMKFRRTGPCQ